MRKTSRLACPPINRNPHINDVADAAEQIREVAIGHLEGHVADEKGFGGWVHGLVLFHIGVELVADAGGVLDRDAPALEERHVGALQGAVGGFLGREVNVAESVEVLAIEQ
jgi:hypothetical protein